MTGRARIEAGNFRRIALRLEGADEILRTAHVVSRQDLERNQVPRLRHAHRQARQRVHQLGLANDFHFNT